MFNLAANAEVDDISIVPEDFRPLYKQSEKGTFIHNADLSPTIKAISGMQGVNTKLRSDVDKFTKNQIKLDALKDWGDTPEAIAETVKTKMAELEAAAKGSSKIDVEKVRQEIMKTAETKIAEADGKVSKMRGSLEAVLIGREAVAAIAGEKGDTELLMPFVSRQVKVVEENGDYKSVVVDADGNTRLNPATGKEMSVAELVKEMKADKKFSRLFESEAPSGGGAQPKAGNIQLNNQNGQRISPVNKIAAGLAARQR